MEMESAWMVNVFVDKIIVDNLVVNFHPKAFHLEQIFFYLHKMVIA